MAAPPFGNGIHSNINFLFRALLFSSHRGHPDFYDIKKGSKKKKYSGLYIKRVQLSEILKPLTGMTVL